MIGKWFHLMSITLSLLCFVVPTWAATITDSALTALFNQYYAANRAGNETRERMLLHQILNRDPNNIRAWRALGYSYSASGDSAKAAQAIARALKLSGHEPLLALQAGYAYDSAGDKSHAERLFEAAMDTQNASIYGKACRASIYDGYLYRKRLPNPWYLTFYTDNFYESRISDVIFPVKIRFGRYVDTARRISVYTYFHFNDDLRSRGGLLPAVYNDNYAGVGFGVDWFPLQNRSLRLFAETGADYNLLDTDRPLWRNDTTTGAEFYQAWGSGNGCTLHATWPLRSFGDAYASMAYYTRYNDAIGQVVIRQGVRVVNYHMTAISAYLELNMVGDTRGVFYNNIVEIGPGLSWRPNERWPLSLRAEYLFGSYIRGVDQSTERNTYTTWLLQAIVYFEQ
jgi:tetratricopeptide (TPR) repeat protein